MLEQILPQLAVSAGIIAASAVVHAVFILLIRSLLHLPDPRPGYTDEVSSVVRLTIVAVWLIGAHGVAAAFWAGAYLQLGVVQDFEEALYFALTTYTTLGFGDVLAPEEWRLLTGFAALNGLLMFGLSAAALVDAAGHLRRPRRLPGARLRQPDDRV